MPAKKNDVNFYFEYKRINPRGMGQDNLIYFNYKSPDGVHDPTPLVYVLEKQLDRFYGLNVHYDNKEFFEIIYNTEEKVNTFLEKEFYRLYPEKKQELQKKRQKFNKTLFKEQDYKQVSKRIPK